MKTIYNLFRLKNIKILLFITGFLFQTSCGFSPVYRVNANNEYILSNIEITPIATLEGADFYNHMKSIFPPEQNTLYILNTTLSFTRSYNIIQPNSDIFRETQNINVTYQLIDKKSLKTLTKGSFSRMSSYSTNFSLYSNSVLRQQSISNLAENAAEEVRNRLLMFLVKRHQ